MSVKKVLCEPHVVCGCMWHEGISKHGMKLAAASWRDSQQVNEVMSHMGQQSHEMRIKETSSGPLPSDERFQGIERAHLLFTWAFESVCAMGRAP